jgi:hypothetical protein
MGRISHDQYLKSILRTKKLTLELIKVEHQKNIVKFEVEKDILTKDIESLERQLEDE